MLKAPPPAREPLERISVGESLARTAQKFGEFQEQGGLAGLVGMEPAATRLARSSRVIRQRFEAGQPFQADPEAMDLALNFSPASLTGMIRAFHGTPHQFGKFDLSKIGTGEGAQAYGHGLYFAGRKGTADFYREAITGANRPPLKTRITVGGTRLEDVLPDEGITALGRVKIGRALEDAGGDVDKALDLLRQQSQPGTGAQFTGEQGAKAKKFWDQTLKQAERLRGKEIKIEAAPEGNLYTVDIDAHADELLDWDKPLSQQSEKVRKAISDMPAFKGRIDEADELIRGEHIYSELANRAAPDQRVVAGERAEALASEALRKAGIKGIRYLDQGSRGAGEGTHNFVVFDDSILNIVNE